MARRRHLSRIAVMQTLFELERHPQLDTEKMLQRNMKEAGGADEEFAISLLAGVLAHRTSIEEMVSTHAPGWTLGRMDPISRCALLIGTEELAFRKEAPPPVVMNEAIDIAKEFGSSESGKFVNGVLNAIAKEAKSS
ncbi:MAG: transcription antitermination factor NusB [Candidatus Peregrinibacteria bacterium]